MSLTLGRMITCDRCKKTTFAKALGDKEMDGGFTRWTEFEKAEGWTREGGGERWKRRWYTLPVRQVAGRCLDLTLCTREVTDSFKRANDKTWFVL